MTEAGGGGGGRRQGVERELVKTLRRSSLLASLSPFLWLLQPGLELSLFLLSAAAMDPTLLRPNAADADEDRSLSSPSTSFGEPDSSWELTHNCSAGQTESSVDHSSDDLSSVLGAYTDQTPWSVRKQHPASASATAGRIVIPEPYPSAVSSTTGGATSSPPSSRFSAWSTGSFVYGRESPPPCALEDGAEGEGADHSDAVQAGLLSLQPLSAPPFPHAVRSLADTVATLSPSYPRVKPLHKALSADWGEARELGLKQRELSPRPVSRGLAVDETAGEGADEAEPEPGSPRGRLVPDSVPDAVPSPTIAGLVATAKSAIGAPLEPASADLTPTPLSLNRLAHRDSLAVSDRTDTTDESCPFFYSPPPLQSNFVRSVRSDQPTLPSSSGISTPHAPPARLDLSQLGASYAFPDPTALARHPGGAPLPAPVPANPLVHPGLLRRPSSPTSACDDSGSDASDTRSFSWVNDLYDLYDLYSPSGEPTSWSQDMGRLDLAGEGEGGNEDEDEARFADPEQSAGYDDSPGFRFWHDDSLGAHSFSSEPGTAPAMQSVFAALQALGHPRAPGSEYDGSFVTACSSARASPHPRSPLGSPLPDSVRLLLAGVATPGDEHHLRRVGSNTSLLLGPPASASGRHPGTPDARELESALLAARGAVFGLENEVHNLRSQLEGARAGEARALRMARWADAAVSELERARAEKGSKDKEIDGMLAELGVDLVSQTVSSSCTSELMVYLVIFGWPRLRGRRPSHRHCSCRPRWRSCPCVRTAPSPSRPTASTPPSTKPKRPMATGPLAGRTRTSPTLTRG